MKKAVSRFFKRADCVIMAAAVADFRPVSFSSRKVKKSSKKNLFLKLKRNPDILSELGMRKERRILVGYSLETDRPVKNAKKKLKSKNLDIIVANKSGNKSNPFGTGAKDIAIIQRKGCIKRLKNASKATIAHILLDNPEINPFNIKTARKSDPSRAEGHGEGICLSGSNIRTAHTTWSRTFASTT